MNHLAQAIADTHSYCPHHTMPDKTQLFDLLYKSCLEHSGLLESTLMDYIDALSEQKLLELEDFLVNNFGDEEEEG